MAKPLRVLFFDIETAPLLAHIWRPGQGWIPHDAILHDSFMLTWSAKWMDAKEVTSRRLTSAQAKAQDDSELVQELADMIRSAEIIVAHNVNNFDVPMLNNRLLAMGLEPLGPVRTIDTLKLARKSFRLAHNKLDYLASYLGHGNKLKTDFELWRSCYLGDDKALRRMERYNREDVRLLEKVFHSMRPYVKMPRLYVGSEHGEHACPGCGGEDFQRRGFYYTEASAFIRVMCKNKKCGQYSRYRSASKNHQLGLHPV